jgi:hypothetical protein
MLDNIALSLTLKFNGNNIKTVTMRSAILIFSYPVPGHLAHPVQLAGVNPDFRGGAGSLSSGFHLNKDNPTLKFCDKVNFPSGAAHLAGKTDMATLLQIVAGHLFAPKTQLVSFGHDNSVSGEES